MIPASKLSPPVLISWLSEEGYINMFLWKKNLDTTRVTSHIVSAQPLNQKTAFSHSGLGTGIINAPHGPSGSAQTCTATTHKLWKWRNFWGCKTKRIKKERSTWRQNSTRTTKGTFSTGLMCHPALDRGKKSSLWHASKQAEGKCALIIICMSWENEGGGVWCVKVRCINVVFEKPLN